MVLPHQTTTKSAQKTQELGKDIGLALLNGEVNVPRVFCLWGELGSGKTTFVQGLAKGLGITSRLLSPTFIIVRRYDIPKTEKVLCHMDLYRMKSESDIEALGFDELISDTKTLIMIEWPERLGTLLPDSRVDVKFETLSDNRHAINIIEV